MPVEEALAVFQDAAQRVEEQYMVLPMSRQRALPLERVYTYELYHQLRTLYLRRDYSWGGEVDKAAHYDFRAPGLINRKPDLVLHQPGNHAGNLLVVQVKMARRITRDNVCADLFTLTAFRTNQGNFHAYKGAIFLLVGGALTDIENVRGWAGTCRDVSRGLIQFWWHEGPGRPPRLIPWR